MANYRVKAKDELCHAAPMIRGKRGENVSSRLTVNSTIGQTKAGAAASINIVRQMEEIRRSCKVINDDLLILCENYLNKKETLDGNKRTISENRRKIEYNKKENETLQRQIETAQEMATSVSKDMSSELQTIRSKQAAYVELKKKFEIVKQKAVEAGINAQSIQIPAFYDIRRF